MRDVRVAGLGFRVLGRAKAARGDIFRWDCCGALTKAGSRLKTTGGNLFRPIRGWFNSDLSPTARALIINHIFYVLFK